MRRGAWCSGLLGAGLMLPFVGGLGLAAGHEADKFLNTTCTLHETQPPQKTTLYASDGKTVLATLFNQDRVPVPLARDAELPAAGAGRHRGPPLLQPPRRGHARADPLGDQHQRRRHPGRLDADDAVRQADPLLPGRHDIKAQEAAIAQNLDRKIEDAKCALYIESVKHESKHTILQNYLNIAFFGENAYGIQTAARTYFNVDAKALTLPQAAMLVGLLRAPIGVRPVRQPAGRPASAATRCCRTSSTSAT